MTALNEKQHPHAIGAIILPRAHHSAWTCWFRWRSTVWWHRSELVKPQRGHRPGERSWRPGEASGSRTRSQNLGKWNAGDPKGAQCAGGSEQEHHGPPVGRTPVFRELTRGPLGVLG